MEHCGAAGFSHTPVLLDECIELLNIRPEGLYVDGTLGGGGHSAEILKRLGPGGRLYGIDRDDDAIAAATERLTGLSTRAAFRVFKGNFTQMGEFCGGERPDGILLDLGVSSHQLDEAERGFSYRLDGPLDMRMDQSAGMSAKDVVNTYSEFELARVFREYGEERYANRIAAAICRERKKAEIAGTVELAELIKSAVPAKYLTGEGHPAKRVFQALRIEVNGELDDLKSVLDTAIELLNEGGRLVVITFHSLEDRIVKNKFRDAENPCTCPPDFPVCVCGKTPLGKVITRHPVTGSAEELAANNRAHSAKVRAFEKCTKQSSKAGDTNDKSGYKRI